eukprot:gene15871-18821_t
MKFSIRQAGFVPGTWLAFSSKSDWMESVERDARISVGESHRFAKGPGEYGAETVFMNKLMHEFKAEGVGSMRKAEEKLEMQLKELNRMLKACTSPLLPLIDRKEAEAAFKTLRIKAVTLKHELVVQREAVGLTRDDAGVIDKQFPIPSLPL